MNAGDPSSKDERVGSDRRGSTLKVRAAIDRVNRLRPVLEPIFRDEGVPVELGAVVLVESGGLPAALSPKAHAEFGNSCPTPRGAMDSLSMALVTNASTLSSQRTQQLNICETSDSDSATGDLRSQPTTQAS